VPTLLPVRLHGRLELVTWGCRHRRGPLPYGGWIDEGQIAAGALSAARPERVVIPATMGFDRGVWYLINEGVCGVVILSPNGPVVYVLIGPATNYYKNMCEQTPTMPVLVDQVI
jgi:hypothetical protein